MLKIGKHVGYVSGFAIAAGLLLWQMQGSDSGVTLFIVRTDISKFALAFTVICIGIYAVNMYRELVCKRGAPVTYNDLKSKVQYYVVETLLVSGTGGKTEMIAVIRLSDDSDNAEAWSKNYRIIKLRSFPGNTAVEDIARHIHFMKMDDEEYVIIKI